MGHERRPFEEPDPDDGLDAPDPANLRVAPPTPWAGRRATLARPMSLPPLGSPAEPLEGSVRPAHRPLGADHGAAIREHRPPAPTLPPMPPLELRPTLAGPGERLRPMAAPPGPTDLDAPTLVPADEDAEPEVSLEPTADVIDEDELERLFARRSPWPLVAAGVLSAAFVLFVAGTAALAWLFLPEPKVYEARLGTRIEAAAEAPATPIGVDPAAVPDRAPAAPAAAPPAREPEAKKPRRAQVRDGQRASAERPRAPAVRVKPKNAAVRPRG